MKVYTASCTGKFYLQGPWEWGPLHGAMIYRWMRFQLSSKYGDLVLITQ